MIGKSRTTFSQENNVNNDKNMNRIIGLAVLLMAGMSAWAQVCIRVDYKEIRTERGPLYQYAHRYLNAKDLITEDGTVFVLENVCIVPERPEALPEEPVEGQRVTTVSRQVHLSEDAILAASTMKMAENVAKQIYRLREARVNVLSGETEHMPADGMSMQLVLNTLNEEEEALTAQFVGRTVVTEHCAYIVCDSLNEGKNIALRFSKIAGPVDKDDLSGEAVRLDLFVTREKQAVPSEGKKKNAEPTYVWVETSRSYTISYNHKTLYEKTIRP